MRRFALAAIIRPVMRSSLLALAFLAAACSGTPDRLPVSATELRLPGSPLALVLVKIVSDTRPLAEHGTFKALGKHQLQHGNFSVPTLVEVAGVIADGLVRSGVALEAALACEDAPYILELDVLHFGTEIAGGLESLLVIAPTCALVATCTLRWRLLDRHGRRFLETTTEVELDGHAVPLVGIESDAAGLLGRALRMACDDGLPQILPAVDAWWRNEGLPPRREPRINPLPVPRSSTGR